MGSPERVRTEAMIELVLEARKNMGDGGSFTTRVLLDMLLLELGRELAAFSKEFGQGKKS